MIAAINWGSVPDWLGGLGATVALVFAFFAVRAAQRTNLQQSQQLEQQSLQLALMEDERRQAQASQVASWPIELDEKVYTHVVNLSHLPVYDVTIWTERQGVIYGRPRLIPIFTPGEFDDPLSMSGDQSVSVHSLSAGMIFRDVSGRYWERESGGLLRASSQDQHATRGKALRVGSANNVAGTF